MTTSSLVINFTPDPRTARPGEKYWIRLEPVEQKPPTATIGQVAEIADKLFEIEPCDDQGNGGEAHPDEMPTEQEVVETAKEVLGHDPCGPDDTGAWSGQVKIYRSHQAEPYRLICTNGKILTITIHDEQVDTVIAVTGKTSVELEKPVYGNFTCDLPGAELIGSTLWFGGAEYTGFVHVQYASSYDLAEISVNGIDDQPQTGHVVAFYHRLVAEADIEPPERDEATEQAIDCSVSWHVDDEVYRPGRCLQKTRHTVRCECFGQEIIDTYETEEEVECPDYAQCPGGFIGCDWYYPIQDVTEYVPCSEITYGPDGSVKRINRGDWEGYDPDYYEDKCCNPPDVSLPPCETKVQAYRGGVEIKGGPEKYRRKYGDDVQLIGVTPENGICGQTITRQVVQSKNCCDEVTPLVWDSENSATVIADNSSGIIYVTGGKLPLTVSVRGSGFWLDSEHSFRDGLVDARAFRVYTGDACGTCVVEVSDGCTFVVGMIASTNGQWGPIIKDAQLASGLIQEDCQYVWGDEYSEHLSHDVATACFGHNYLVKQYEIRARFKPGCNGASFPHYDACSGAACGPNASPEPEWSDNGCITDQSVFVNVGDNGNLHEVYYCPEQPCYCREYYPNGDWQFVICDDAVIKCEWACVVAFAARKWQC